MVSENSIDKYLQGITTINTTLGRLDVLKLHLKDNYNDNMADAILDSVIKDLSGICGVEYKMIEVNNANSFKKNQQIEKDIKIKRNIKNEPVIIKVTEIDNEDFNVEKKKNIVNRFNFFNKDKKHENTNIAEATLHAETVKTEKQKAVKLSEGVQVDDRTGNMVYEFVNSNTLNYVLYNRSTKTMTVNFAKNGRTYEYYHVPMYMFDNMVNIDEAGGSAGAYFQQNIARKWKKGMYKEITDTQLIG